MKILERDGGPVCGEYGSTEETSRWDEIIEIESLACRHGHAESRRRLPGSELMAHGAPDRDRGGVVGDIQNSEPIVLRKLEPYQA